MAVGHTTLNPCINCTH